MAKKRTQLEYYWDTVYKILNKDYSVDVGKLKAIDNFLKYVGNESNELMNKSIEVNRDTWVASVALSDITSTTEEDGTVKYVSSQTSGERNVVLDTTSAMETIDYSNNENNEVASAINNSIVRKINRDLEINNMNIDDRINLKLRRYRDSTRNNKYKDIIDNILNKKPLNDVQKREFKERWQNMLRDGIGINKEELSRILEDDNYKDILSPSERSNLLNLAQDQFYSIDSMQKNNYANAKKREMKDLYHNTHENYERTGIFNDWRGGVLGKLKDSKRALFKTVNGKLQFDENKFNEIISGLDIGTDEESKTRIKNMVGDLRGTIKELTADGSNGNSEQLLTEAMDRVFGTRVSLHGGRYDLKSVDKAEEALIMRAIRDEGMSSSFRTTTDKAAFENEFINLDASEGAKKLDEYLSFNGNNAVIKSGLNEDQIKIAEKLKNEFDKYKEMTFDQLTRLASSIDSIANSQDTATIINNYYMSNGQIQMATDATSEV